MPQRIGPWSRAIIYPEGTWNSDSGISTGYVAPLVDVAGVGDSSDELPVPIFTGDLLPYDTIDGMIQSGGDLSLGMEYLTAPIIAKRFFTTNGYARPGSQSLHHFFIPSTAGSQPGSFQLQYEWLESTAKYLRFKGLTPTALSYAGDMAGFSRYGVSFLGSGTQAQTDLAGTKTDNGFSASNYFNGQMVYNSGGTKTTLADVKAFNCRFLNNAVRSDVFFNSGIAASINGSNINAEGALRLNMNVGGSGPAADLAFYNDAINRTRIELDLVMANGPLATCTSYVRFQFTALRFSRMAPKVGGGGPLEYEQSFRMIRSSSAKTAGEYILPTLGTYNIGATTNKLGIKIDGGATQTFTLTQGAARTATQVVADLAALSGGVADVYLGRVRITSNTTGTSSSVQIDTSVVDTGHTLFGANNTARTGRADCPVLVHFFNTSSSDTP